MGLAKTLNVTVVYRPKAFGNEAVERLSDGILGWEEKHSFSSGIK